MSIDPVTLIRRSMVHVKTRKLNRFLDGAANAAQVQRDHLLQRIVENASSRFGQDFGFAQIRGVEDFRRQLPISNYESHRPYIQEVLQGNVEAMFAKGTQILMFATTSGTTDKPKLLPVTEQFYHQYRASWQYWGTGVYRDYPGLVNLKTLQFSSRYDVEFSPTGIPCGNISGLAAETRPFYISTLFVLPSTVVKISNHAAKHYTALRLSLASRKIGMIVTANPSTLIEVAQRADLCKEELIRDIHNGTLSQSVEVPDQIRQALRSRLRKDPKRARELQQIADREGHLYPKDAWPQLTIIAVWTGGSVGLYLSQLPQYYGNVAIRDHGISASEGRMTIPLSNDSDDGILDYASHYYEFIPAEEHGTENPTVLEAHELEVDKNYYILLSTAAGLYRYDIHDLVRCHGFHGQAPLLSFLNKGKNFSSFTGEKLSEHQVMQAMRETLKTLQLNSSTFTLAPSITNSRPKYNLIVSEGPLAHAGDRLADEMQRQLEKVNVEYADKCSSGRILPVGFKTVPAGTFEKLRSDKSQARGNFEEYKHPCLTSDLDFISRITGLMPSSNTRMSEEPTEGEQA